MNRRGFIGALLGAATLDPERALWVPGKRLISIPRPQKVVGCLINTNGITMRMTQMYDAHGRYAGTRMDLMMGKIALDGLRVVVKA